MSYSRAARNDDSGPVVSRLDYGTGSGGIIFLQKVKPSSPTIMYVGHEYDNDISLSVCTSTILYI